MANEDIRITIQKGDSPEGTSSTSSNASTQRVEARTNKREEGKPNLAKEAAATAVIQVAKQAIMTTVQKYGDLTGDYSTVRNIDSAMSATADILTVMQGGVAGLVYVAGKYAVQAVNANIDHFRKTQEHQFNVQRLGTISVKGSRY